MRNSWQLAPPSLYMLRVQKSGDVTKHYTPYSTRMSPEITHKLMGIYIEVLILGVYLSTWFLLLYAVSYRVYRVKLWYWALGVLCPAALCDARSLQMWIKRDGSVQGPLWPKDIREIVTSKYLKVHCTVHCVCVCVCACAHVDVCVWRGRGAGMWVWVEVHVGMGRDVCVCVCVIQYAPTPHRACKSLWPTHEERSPHHCLLPPSSNSIATDNSPCSCYHS